MTAKREITLPDRVSKQAELFVQKNPELAEALELFKVTKEQYEAALQPLSRAEIISSNSTNQD